MRLGAQIGISLFAALIARSFFWAFRERHLFWGDGLPLSIDVPKGLAFHPDEPLTVYLHHLLYRLGGGHWSGATAVAMGSTLAGMVFVGLGTFWFLRRGRDSWACALAAAVFFAQGFMALFYGHVENYSYLAVALLVFFVSGVDFLEGRGGPYVPIAAALLAYALHILGGLTLLPAAVLIAYGLANRERRRETVFAVIGALLVAAIASRAAAGLYVPNGRTPLDGVISGAARVFGNARDMQASELFSWRHWRNAWSQWNLVGPLTVVWLGLVALLLGRGARSPVGWFFLAGSAALLGPSVITGEGNLGAARNWDLFAAPALVAPLAGITLLLERLETGQARRLMLALLAASLFHTVPWIGLNTSVEGTIARVQRLPLTNGRGEIMIGTHYLNDGRLDLAEEWFRRGLERDNENANAQSGLGVTLAREGRLVEALPPMIAATQLRPGVVTYQDDLISLFLALQRWQQAAAVLHDRLAEQPTDVDSWEMLANCHERAGDADGAVSVLEEGCRMCPSERTLTRSLGDAYELAVVQHGKRSEWPQAKNQLDRFAAAFPEDPRVARLRQGLP
jgi:tetratricopeptide (TPR) repeat protein